MSKAEGKVRSILQFHYPWPSFLTQSNTSYSEKEIGVLSTGVEPVGKIIRSTSVGIIRISFSSSFPCHCQINLFPTVFLPSLTYTKIGQSTGLFSSNNYWKSQVNRVLF